MRIALFALLGLISCAAPGSEDLELQSYGSIQDSASYYFNRIDSGLATSEELDLATRYVNCKLAFRKKNYKKCRPIDSNSWFTLSPFLALVIIFGG